LERSKKEKKKKKKKKKKTDFGEIDLIGTKQGSKMTSHVGQRETTE
jgi:hypothetical protein